MRGSGEEGSPCSVRSDSLFFRDLEHRPSSSDSPLPILERSHPGLSCYIICDHWTCPLPYCLLEPVYSLEGPGLGILLTHLPGFSTCLPTQDLEAVPLEALLCEIKETRWERKGFVFASVVLTERPTAFFLPINMCGFLKRLTVLEV